MTFWDRILIFLIVALIGLLLFNTYFRNSGERMLVVSTGGRQVMVIDKKEFLESEILSIPLERGEARIEIDGGKARILPMPKELCPRSICSAFGWIKRPGEAAICVPNLLIVEVRGVDKINAVDSVAR